MTQESGRTPSHQVGRLRQEGSGVYSVSAQSLIIVKLGLRGVEDSLEWSRVAMCPMSMQCLRVVTEVVEPWVRMLAVGSRVFLRAPSVSACEDWINKVTECFEFLADDGVEGMEGRIWFVWQDQYAGLRPCGEGHWFHGVTDAIGVVGSQGRKWIDVM